MTRHLVTWFTRCMDSVRVIVYVRADDARHLRATNRDPAEWVRGLVRFAIDRDRAREKETNERLRRAD